MSEKCYCDKVANGMICVPCANNESDTVERLLRSERDNLLALLAKERDEFGKKETELKAELEMEKKKYEQIKIFWYEFERKNTRTNNA